LRLRTFGGLSVDAPEARSPGRAAQRRQLALLALLAAQRHRPLTRDKLVGFFWPDRPDAEARHALAQLVYRTRQEFGNAVLVSGADDVRTDPSGFGADVIDFMEASERGDLEGASRCYTGPFLDGFYLDKAPEFERWVDETRAMLATRCATNLTALARVASNAGRTSDAVTWLRRLSALDPLSAPVALDLMKALVAAGDVTAALQHATVHARLLRSEMDAPPDAGLIEYANALRAVPAVESVAGSVIIPVPAPLPPPVPAPAPVSIQPHTRRPWRTVTAVVAVALAISIGLVTRPWRAITAAMVPRLVVLGDIEGPDTGLTLAVHEALRSGLESDPEIRVIGETQMRGLLRLMSRRADTRIDGPIADELALRAGAALAIVGSAVPVGNGVAIVVRILNPKSGQARLTLSERALNTADVIPALARVHARIRRDVVGGSGDTLLAPLPYVMTSSLAALQDYAFAREALRHNDRFLASRWANAALGEDSLFPMANYLAGDLNWFFDHQRAAEVHLTRALLRPDRLPLKERLLVAARYQELVADRSDSALVLWEGLRTAFPGDGLAYDGMAWTLRALGRNVEAAAAADTALQLDATTFGASMWNEVYALIDIGEIAHARALFQGQPDSIRREYGVKVDFYAALRAHDWARALQMYPDSLDSNNSPYRQIGLLVSGRFAEAVRLIPTIRVRHAREQFLPRAVSLQARAELADGVVAPSHSAAAREVLAFLEASDLSAPATARLAERAAELAARVHDPATIASTRRLLLHYDAGRGRPSIGLALKTVDAAAALERGDFRAAAQFALAAREGMFHGRSLALAALMEADAREALGEIDAARQLYADLSTPTRFGGGDLETWAVLQAEVAHKLQHLRAARLPEG